MATDLATLLQQIPQAEDGKLITPDYHNSLRAALLALANQAATPATPAKGATQLVLVPNFIPWGNKAPNWEMQQGVAVAGKDGADGILPINLRDNEEPAFVVVTGLVPSDGDDMIRQFKLELVQQSVLDDSANRRAVFVPQTAEIDFENTSGRFSIKFAARFGDVSPGRLPERGRAAKTAPVSNYLRIAVSSDLVRTAIWGVVLGLK